MLLSRDTYTTDITDTHSVHNYYERLVLEELYRVLPAERRADDLLADIVCVALNHLPPRYIRHDVDMAFYLSPHEQMEMEKKVQNAVAEAIHFVETRAQRDEPDA